MRDSFVDFSRQESCDAPFPSRTHPTPRSTEASTKRPPSEDGSGATGIYRFDKENDGREQTWKRRTSPPHNAASLHCKRSKDDATATATFYPIPLGPPMMRYTSSAAFSDISMPIHGLSASKSFGPSGLFHAAVHPSLPLTLLRSTSTIATGANDFTRLEPEAKEEPSLSCYPVGVNFSVDEINHHQSNSSRSEHRNSNSSRSEHRNSNSSRSEHRNSNSTRSEHRNSNHASLGDLSLAASALLDLTPTVSMELQFQNPTHGGHGHRFPVSSFDPSIEQLPGVAGSYAHVQAFNARLDERAGRLLYNVPVTFMACKCKNTKCLKLYCTCFQGGAYCDGKLCRCQGCHNTVEHSTLKGARTKAVFEILSRRLDAFEPRLRKKTGHGCSCKKSRCLQKYCDCFANGSACTFRCSCDDCSNNIATNFTANDSPINLSEGSDNDATSITLFKTKAASL